jgi:Ca2+:H+ antiporter
MSHGVAIILLLLYVFFMLFQMWTHAHLYADDEPGTATGSTRHRPEIANLPGRAKSKARQQARKLRSQRAKKVDEEAVAVGETKEQADGAGVGLDTSSPEGTLARHASASSVESDDQEVPQMNMPVTILVMVADAVIVGVTAEFLVDSINGMVVANPSLSAEWVGLILLPIVSRAGCFRAHAHVCQVGNAAEHFTAISVAVKDKLDLSISVAVGSSIQVALFVIPVIQLVSRERLLGADIQLAWCINKPMTLLFDPFESVMLFFTVLIVNQTMADGRSK